MKRFNRQLALDMVIDRQEGVMTNFSIVEGKTFDENNGTVQATTKEGKILCRIYQELEGLYMDIDS